MRAMGIRDRLIAARHPWQNGYAERVIGSIRRECLDGTIVFGEAHLRRILNRYASYYNDLRTHLSLAKDTPIRGRFNPAAILSSGRSSVAFITITLEYEIFGKD